MLRLFILVTAIIIAGCSSSPPMPPEPEGQLVKVNIKQPHETYEGETNE